MPQDPKHPKSHEIDDLEVSSTDAETVTGGAALPTVGQEEQSVKRALDPEGPQR